MLIYLVATKVLPFPNATIPNFLILANVVIHADRWVCSAHARTNFYYAIMVKHQRYKPFDFLTHYTGLLEFGLFVDRHGHPSRSSGTIEWEGTAVKVAMHAPYVLLFDTRFIEIRHVETGRLVQIIPGTDVHCVWDGRNLEGGTGILPVEGSDDHMVQEPRVHAVMNMTEPAPQPSTRAMRGVMQHVFELFPTIPLYLPGSLASPSSVPYFPLSFSPPRSPPLRAHHM